MKVAIIGNASHGYVPLAEQIAVGYLGEIAIVDDDRVYNYLRETRDGLRNLNIPALKTIENSFSFALNSFNTNKRNETLKMLAYSEKKKGFFSTLYEMYEHESLSGVFKKLKERKVGKKIIHQFNRVNPLTIAARNAFKSLVSINLFGLATILSSNNPKAKNVYAKTIKLYVNLGGKEVNIKKSIEKGKTHKPLLNKEAKEAFEKNKAKKIDGLGELGTITLAATIATAGALLGKVWGYVKDAGLALGKKESGNKKTEISSQLTIPAQKEEKKGLLKKLFTSAKPALEKYVNDNTAKKTVVDGKNNDNDAEAAYNSSEAKNESDNTEKNKKTLIIAASVAAIGTIGGIIYYRHKKKK